MLNVSLLLLFAAVAIGQSTSQKDKPAAPPPAVAPSDAQPQGASASSVVPEISPELGNCSVEFKVTTLRGDGIYDAKITTTIRYGFMNKRRAELQIGTNADGRARFIRLPNEVKNPIVFRVRYGEEAARYTWDPGNDCHATYSVPLRVSTSR